MSSITRRMKKKRPKNAVSAAYTFLELVVVLLILGILAGVAAPTYFTALANQRVEAAARRIAADLALAQREAARTSSPRSVEFSVAGNTYRLPDVADLDRPNQEYQVDLATTGYPVDLLRAIDGSETITFDVYGQPDTVGEIEVGSGPARATVTIDASGGVSTTR